MMKIPGWKTRLTVYGALVLFAAAYAGFCTMMPGHSASAADLRPDLKRDEIAQELKRDVDILAGRFGGRNLEHPKVLEGAALYLESRMEGLSRLQVRRELVETPDGNARNIYVNVPGTKAEKAVLIIGAHYDTAPTTPGANDNGTGVAAALALLERFAKRPASGPIRFVLFANEEPPYFMSQWMGSLRHAKGCAARGEQVLAMISLETLGYYSEEEGSQKYPFPAGLFYPSRGNFVAFVSNTTNRTLVRSAIGSFRNAVDFPSEGAALPESMPGIAWSDHWSFWQYGYPAIMVTDTAPFRDKNYHEETDRGDELDFDRLALIVQGLEATIRELSGAQAEGSIASARGGT